MANTIIHKADSRGYANHGWLKAKHSFSFANYYNPERMHFGALRVLNDDNVEGGMGFGTHPHNNMEIITIPLAGAIEHKDSMGNGTVIKRGDIQVMSAGSGIMHSEFNHNKNVPLQLLQIWVFPDKKNVEPRYQQIALEEKDYQNKLLQIVSPHQEDEGVWIHQNAWFNLGNFSGRHQVNYKLKSAENGVYAFVINGSFQIDGTILSNRDGIGIWNTDGFDFKAMEDNSEILLMEIPMKF
ncbi:MAG: pirin family protein [Crocinitomicaceae bacterium]|nr:pirin family protein [Crocinitomicaceae bacterium]